MSKIEAEAFGLGIVPPSPQTLEKYGLTSDEWLAILKAQGWQCPICEKSHKRWNTDHEHVRGWAKMPPHERKLYVRGVLCWHCNHKVVRDTRDAAQAQRVADYLKAYDERRTS